MALGCTIPFATTGLFMKKLTRKEVGFRAGPLTMSTIFIVGVLEFLWSIYYFATEGIDWHLFWLGLLGSMMDTAGCVLAMNAYSTGPLSIIAAMVNTDYIYMILLDILRTRKLPHTFEYLALGFGVFGTMHFIVPSFMENRIYKRFCCCLF
jgi:drug/metabolite transporter (DMT)-like permease